jgi:hypothetical protein
MIFIAINRTGWAGLARSSGLVIGDRMTMPEHGWEQLLPPDGIMLTLQALSPASDLFEVGSGVDPGHVRDSWIHRAETRCAADT